MFKDFYVTYQNNSYIVTTKFKKGMRNIHFRFDGEKFLISCSPWTLKSQVIKGLDQYALTLIKKAEYIKNNQTNIKDDAFYLFGERLLTSESGSLTIGDYIINYQNKNELEIKLQKYFLCYLKSRCLYFANLMNLKMYNVKVKSMKTRFGSNSKRSKTWCFNFVLIHFSKEIIDSVIVHELAHCYYFDHSNNFYRVVYQYCPNYQEYRKKLIRRIYR